MNQLSGSKLLGVAVICGLLAAVLTVLYLNRVEDRYRQAHQPKPEVKVAVVVAKRDMQKGQIITVKDIQKLDMPERFVPAYAILAKDYKKILNRTLQTATAKGRPMTWQQVTGNAAKTFSENVELGTRAMSIKVSKVDSFDGLLRPGDHIDLMGNFDLKDFGVSASGQSGTSSEVVMPVLENVEVLSAGREDHTGRRYERKKNKMSADGFDMEFTIITVKLTPAQVARVELAEQTGDIFAVLRHPKDTSVAGYQYKEVGTLLEADKPAAVDMVLDENGKPIGRIVGDNVVDANGNIIGKVVDGKAVTFDGKPLGKIVENVDSDDPVNRVAEVADVVRDANGNVIGKVVDGKIIDADGNVVGMVDKDGTAIATDGRVLGKVEKGVALDANGNVVDMKGSSAAVAKTQKQTVVRDASGKVIGRVVDGKVVDENGNVVGRIDANGRAVSLTGESLGSVDEVMVDRDGKVVGTVQQVVRDANGNVVGRVEQVVRDANGNVVGRVVNGQVVDANGKVIGRVDENGNPVSLDGESLGSVEKAVVDSSGKVVGKVTADGKVIGNDGASLGVVETAVVDANGNVVSELEQVVRDANGNVIGVIKNGQVVDANGKVIGKVDGDKVVGLDGKVIAEGVAISTEDPLVLERELKQQREKTVVREVNYIDFISGGTGKEGITPVMRVRLD